MVWEVRFSGTLVLAVHIWCGRFGSRELWYWQYIYGVGGLVLGNSGAGSTYMVWEVWFSGTLVLAVHIWCGRFGSRELWCWQYIYGVVGLVPGNFGAGSTYHFTVLNMTRA